MQSFRILMLACGTVALGVCATSPPPSVSRTDRDFMTSVARMDMTGAHEGQMAEDKASRTDVKDLAKTLVKDDSEAYGHLLELSAKTGVTIPRGIDAARIPAIEGLHAAKGAEFDRQFTRDQIANQQHALAAFQHEARYGHNSDVKAYANSMIPILKNDLTRAQQCDNVKIAAK